MLEPSSIVAVVIALGAVSALGYAFYVGFRCGYKRGHAQGFSAATDDLLLMKDTDAWDKARCLKLEERQRAETERMTNAKKR